MVQYREQVNEVTGGEAGSGRINDTLEADESIEGEVRLSFNLTNSDK